MIRFDYLKNAERQNDDTDITQKEVGVKGYQD